MNFDKECSVLQGMIDGLTLGYIAMREMMDKADLHTFIKSKGWDAKSTIQLKTELKTMRLDRERDVLLKHIRTGGGDVVLPVAKVKKPKPLSKDKIRSEDLKRQKRLEKLITPAKIKAALTNYGFEGAVNELGFRHKEALRDACKKNKINIGDYDASEES